VALRHRPLVSEHFDAFTRLLVLQALTVRSVELARGERVRE